MVGSDFINPQETNFEALCRLSRLYMVAVIDFLEDKFGPGAIKMLAFSDFVFKPGDRVKCKNGIKVCDFMDGSPQGGAQGSVREHGGG